MTLLIACLIIHAHGMPPWLYWVATAIWVMSVGVHVQVLKDLRTGLYASLLDRFDDVMTAIRHK